MALFRKSVKDIKLDKFVESKIHMTKKIAKNNKTLIAIGFLGGLYHILSYFEVI